LHIGKEEPLQYAHRPERLSRVFEYAEDRAAFLDVREAVAAALEIPTDTNERAELVLEAMRPIMVRTLARRLEHDAGARDGLAAVMVAAVLP
jgi:hypothetical protein